MVLRTATIQLAREYPHLRRYLVPILRQAASKGEGKEEETSTPTSGRRRGPPAKWHEFLKAVYQGGKKRVPNPNSRTRQRFPDVALSTALRDKPTMKRVMKEYAEWVKKQREPGAAKKTKAPTKQEAPTTLDLDVTTYDRGVWQSAKAELRVKDIITKAKGNKKKEVSLAQTMAKRITSKEKAYVRHLAAKKILGKDHPITKIFFDRAKELMGGTAQPAETPKKEKVPEPKKKVFIPLPKAKKEDLNIRAYVNSEIGKQALKALKLKTPEEAADVTGASVLGPRGATVSVTSTYDGGVIRVSVEGAKNIYRMNRSIHYDSYTKKRYIHNDEIRIADEAPRGLGTKIFASQVAYAKKHGFSHIECNAFRASWQQNESWVGYKVWPKLGYDGEIPPNVTRKFRNQSWITEAFDKAGFKEPYTVRNLYKIPGGREWWEKEGDAFDATFDLTDGAESLTVLSEYLDKRAKEDGMTDVSEWMAKTAAKKPAAKKKPAKKDHAHQGHEEITLDEKDHKILNKIWEKRQKKAS